jgi:hypothetical protein
MGLHQLRASHQTYHASEISLRARDMQLQDELHGEGDHREPFKKNVGILLVCGIVPAHCAAGRRNSAL